MNKITEILEMKTRKSFPTTLGLSEIIDRKEIMKNVDEELKEKENHKPELTLFEQLEKKELYSKFNEMIKNGNLEGVKELLKSGVDINEKNYDVDWLLMRDEGWTALMHASKYGNIEIATLLINNPKIKINEKDNSGNTALMYASKYGNIEIVKLLLNDSKIKINEKNNEGWTALIFASENGYLEIVKLLINDSRTELNEKNNKGCTALMYTVIYNRAEITKMLIDADVDLNVQNRWGETALSLAKKDEHLEIIELLESKGAK